MNKPLHGLFAIVVFAMLGVVSSAFGDACWTRGTYDASTWTPPEDTLVGYADCSSFFFDLSVNNTQCGTDQCSLYWNFQEPKNLSSILILMNSVRYNVAGLYVQHAGSDTNFYPIADTAFDFTTGVSGQTCVTYSDGDGYFAEDVSGFRIVVTNMYPSWANQQEIVLTGVPSDTANRWKVSRFTSGSAYEPAADKLDGLVVPGSDSWSNSGSNINDNNRTSYWYSSSALVWNFATPKRLRRVAFSGGESGDNYGIKMAGVYVKHSGESDYTLLKGSVLDTVGKFSRYNLELVSDNDYLDRDVVSVKFQPQSIGWRIALGEVEVDGSDSFVSTLYATYAIGGGKLNTTLAPTASVYPKQVWFCSGDTDGGTDTNAWDRVIPAYIASSSDPVIDSRIVDFKYCRYCFMDVDNDAWTEPFELSLTPVGSTSVISNRRNDASVSVSLSQGGGTNEVADVYFAYALADDTLPAYSLLAKDLAQGAVVTNCLTGLSETTNYNYSVKMVNVDGGEQVLNGSFATKGICYWVKGVYSSSMEWAKPTDRICCNADGSYFDDSLSTASTSDAGATRTYTWDEPQDIDSLELYIKGAKDWTYEVKSVAVKYSGADDYTVLSGSYLYYSDKMTDQKKSTLCGTVGKLAEDVVGLQIVFGSFDNSWAHGVAELVIHGKATGSTVRWNYAGVATADDLTHPDDVLTNSLVTLSGFSTCEHDDSLSAYSERGNGTTWTWNFSKPHDIRTVEFWGYGYAARSRFRISSVQYKCAGDDDYTRIAGSYIGYFGYDTAGHRAILESLDSEWIVRKVTSVKLVLGQPVNSYVLSAEVRCTGRESPMGLMLILR